MANEKIKILMHSEFFAGTGFSRVAENLVKELIKTGNYEFTIIGGEYHGEPYDHVEWPITVYPCLDMKQYNKPEYQDPRGAQRMLDQLVTGEYDILFTIYDPMNVANFGPKIKAVLDYLKKEKKKVPQWVYYFPTESYVRNHWVENAISLADYPVSYTKYGAKEVLKVNPNLQIKTISHGVNPQEFYPLSKEENKKNKDTIFGGLFKDRFVVSNINRNVRRKDIPRTLKVFKKFQEQVPNAILYLHMRHNDGGGDFRVMANDIGLVELKDYVHPVNMQEFDYPVEIINMIYNVSDMVISTSHGEGWGLSITESFATKTPFVGPNNTSFTEICEGRGLLAEVREGEEINYGPSDFNLWRPIVDIDDMVKQMVWVYDEMAGKDEKKMVDSAYEWVQELSWDKIAKQWDNLFQEANKMSLVVTANANKKVDRNSECPCGSGKKYKKCCGK